MSSFFRGLFSQRKNIHNIVASGTIEQLNAAIEEDNGKSVNEITRGGKSTLSLLIQRHKSPSECMASNEDTFVKFGILLDYADHKNISIFLDAFKYCPADMYSKINLILILLQKLTKEGEEMIKHITETKEKVKKQLDSGQIFHIKHSFDVDTYRSVERDFDLARTIREKIEGDIDPFTGIKGSLDKVYSKRFEFIYEKIDNFTTFINQPVIEKYISSEQDYDDYETQYGGKRNQRKTKRNQKKKKRNTRRY